MRSSPSLNKTASSSKKKNENIKVCLRLRPINKLEESRRSRHCVQVHPEQTSLTVDSPLEGEYDFSFDKVFPETASQQTIYEFVGSDVASDLLQGLNCAVVAYGQTGTGKTHTMMGVGGGGAIVDGVDNRDGEYGSDQNDEEYYPGSGDPSNMRQQRSQGPSYGGEDDENNPYHHQQHGNMPNDYNNSGDMYKHNPEDNGLLDGAEIHDVEDDYDDDLVTEEDDEDDETSGIIPRIIRDLFQAMSEAQNSLEYVVRCSYIEIYLEKVFDLLDPSSRSLTIVDGTTLMPLQQQILAENAGLLTSATTKSNNSQERESPNKQEQEQQEQEQQEQQPNDPTISLSSTAVSLIPLIPTEGIYIQGASEACCFDEADVVALLVRGNACRTVSSTRMNTDSSRSHAIFVVTLEQYDSETGMTKQSRLFLVDLAGSEMAGKTKKKGVMGPNSMGGIGNNAGVGPLANAVQVESMIINRSLSALGSVVKSLSETQAGGRSRRREQQQQKNATSNKNQDLIPYKASKLTRVLKDAFGGNCRTTLILTASPSSYNISETINTIRFGQRAKRVLNTPKPNIDKSIFEYKRLVQNSKESETKYCKLFKLLVEEKDIKNLLSTKIPKVLKDMETILTNVEKNAEENKKSLKQSKTQSSRSRRGAAAQQKQQQDDTRDDSPEEKLTAAQAEIEQLKRENKLLQEVRDQSDSQVSELQSELAVLRTQNETLNQEKKKDIQDLIDAKNEVQLLLSQKLELEHDYRTSQFRENEAVIFLRQFRKFYRRLLRNKASQGSGDTLEVINNIPGAPELADLIDIDIVLYESGLIEEEEMHDDSSVASFRPSPEAITRSSSAAHHDKMGDVNPANAGGNSVNDGYEGTIVSEVTMDEAIKPPPSMNLPPSRSWRGGGAAGAGDLSGRYDGGRSIRAESTGLDTISELGDGGVSLIHDHMHQAQAHDISRSFNPHAIEENPHSPHDGEMHPEGGGADPSPNRGNAQRQNANVFHPSSDQQHRSMNAEREKEMQIDLRRTTDKCVQLQIALNDAQANVELLTKSGNMNQKKLAQEAMSMREALDRKSHDLQAIIWKMNELHLINKTYNEKMANRDQHVHYLEECLMDLQNTNRNLVMDKQESEAKLREELENLQVLVDAMTIPLWQFGECGVTKRNLASRIILPIRGGHPQQLLQQEDWDELEPLPQHRREPQYDDDASHAFSLDSSTCEMTPETTDVDINSNVGENGFADLQRTIQEVTEREKDMLDHVQEVEEKNNQLTAWEKDLESASQDLKTREEDCTRKEKDLQEEVEKLELKDDDLNMKEAEFGLKLRNWVNKSQTSNQSSEHLGSSRSLEVEVKLADIMEREATLTVREKNLRKKEKEIHRRESEISSYEELTMNDEEHKENEMFQERENMENMLRTKERELSFKAKQIEQREDEIDTRLEEAHKLLEQAIENKKTYKDSIANRSSVNTNEVLMELINKEIDLMNKEEEVRAKELVAAEKMGSLNKRDHELQTLEAEIQWRSEEIKTREIKLAEQEKELEVAIREKKDDADAHGAAVATAFTDDKANPPGYEEGQRKWFNEHQDEKLKNREDALWELEDTIRNFKGSHGWDTTEKEGLGQNEFNIKTREQGLENKEEKIKILQVELDHSKKTIDEMQSEMDKLVAQIRSKEDELQKNLITLKNKEQPQQVYESRAIGDTDYISSTPSLQRIEKMGKAVKTTKELMRMEVDLMMRSEEICVREEELLSKQEDLNRKEVQLRLLEDDQGLNSSQIEKVEKRSSFLSMDTDLTLVSKEADLQRRREALDWREDEMQWKTKALDQREEDALEREQEIERQEEDLVRREEDLDHRKEELERLENKLEAQVASGLTNDVDVNRRRFDMDNKRDDLHNKIDEVKQNKDTEIAQKITALKNKENELRIKEEDLGEREDEISEQIDVIQYKEDELREKEEKLLAIEEQLNDDLKNVRELKEVEEIIQLKQSEIENKENMIKKLGAELKSRDDEMDRQEKLIQNMNEEVHECKKVVNDYKKMESDLLKRERAIEDLKEELSTLESNITLKNEAIQDLEWRLAAKEHQKRTIDIRPAEVTPLQVILGLDSSIGGWPSSYKPKRLNPKFNKNNIKAGVVKVTSTQVRRAKSKFKTAAKVLMLSKLKHLQ